MKAYMARFTADDAGVYGDGTFGHAHTVRKAVDMAMSAGWEPKGSEAVATLMADPMVMDEVGDEAAAYLTDRCDEGLVAGWNEGDFGIWYADEQ